METVGKGRQMKKQTVKRSIFIANAAMILVTIAIVGLINIGVVKIYWEFFERTWESTIATVVDTENIGNILEEWTLHQRSFYVLLVVDVLVCCAVWIGISLMFTRRLTEQIMTPLNALGEGTGRIRRNELTEKINYSGDEEFEEICNTFNDMQAHILSEQEKNRKYEKARTEMIAGISHDLRTPLTAIRGSIKGILDGVVTEDAQKEKFLQTAYRRTGDMDVLLRQLFYISKLETGNMPLQLQQTDLASWISTYLKGKMELLAEEDIEFTEELEAGLEPVWIDQEQFSRILDNLVENSRKYARVSPLRIHVELQETQKGILLRFSDNGQGVAEEKLPFLFDEFYRGDESRNQKEGNGLGLYIVKTLIEAMGGQVSAENSDGFCVIVELPKHS